MSREHESPEELKSLERQLVGFAPANLRIDRDRLMFLAGAASVTASEGGVHRGSSRNATEGVPYSAARLWPAATVALAATSLALLVALFTRPAPQPLIVYLPAATPVSVQPNHSPEQPIAPTVVAKHAQASRALRANVTDNYLRTRDVALRLGLDALGTSSADGSSSPPPSYRDWLLSLSLEAAPESGLQLDSFPRM